MQHKSLENGVNIFSSAFPLYGGTMFVSVGKKAAHQLDSRITYDNKAFT